MADAVDVSLILTLHREGLVVAPTVKSLKAAEAHFKAAHNRTTETIVVADRADALTVSVAREAFGGDVKIIETDEGDPGMTRNRGIEAASGTCASFLDGDDLWSYNWLTEAWTAWSERPDAVWHSACNVVFGEQESLWWHRDSEDPSFDANYLLWANYWDAMSFASTELFRKYPFRKNDLALGFGHEDWHWNCLTFDADIAHKPVLNTAHYKRRRVQSQMSKVHDAGAVVWPLGVA